MKITYVEIFTIREEKCIYMNSWCIFYFKNLVVLFTFKRLWKCPSQSQGAPLVPDCGFQVPFMFLKAVRAPWWNGLIPGLGQDLYNLSLDPLFILRKKGEERSEACRYAAVLRSRSLDGQQQHYLDTGRKGQFSGPTQGLLNHKVWGWPQWSVFTRLLGNPETYWIERNWRQQQSDTKLEVYLDAESSRLVLKK